MTPRLTPGSSALHLFGAELRAWRRRSDLSQHQLARKIPYSASQIGRVEKAERWPTRGFAEACDNVMRTQGALTRMWPAVDAQHRQAATHPATIRGSAEQTTSPLPAATDPAAAATAPVRVPTHAVSPVSPARLGPDLAARTGLAYRRQHSGRSHQGDPGDWTGAPGIDDEVAMTAHDSSDHAERAERRDIGQATLDQIRADVVRLAREFVTAQPLAMFRELRRVRDRINAALDRRLWPHDQTELYFLLGCVSDLMACAATNLGYPHAAEELLRAGWAYAAIIDHRLLMAHLRLELGHHAYWNNQPRHSRDLALSGLDYVSDGQDAAALHLVHARAVASLGDDQTARAAITAAHEARDRGEHDDLLDIGGEFGLSRASQYYLAGSTLLQIPDATPDAAAELEQAATLYQAGPEPGEYHHYAFKALAAIDLAAAQLRAGALDAATATLEPPLSLPASQRVYEITQRMTNVRRELTRPAYRGQTTAAELHERIEDFTRHTVTDDLADLTGQMP